MNAEQYRQVKPGDKVLAYIGGHQHVCRIVEWGPWFPVIGYKTKAGRMGYTSRHYSSLRPLDDQAMPVGPVERRFTAEAIREFSEVKR